MSNRNTEVLKVLGAITTGQLVTAAVLFAGTVHPALAGDVALDPAGVEFFEKKVRPVLVEHCYKCHSAEAEKLKGGLRLDSAAGVRAGGESGAVIVPGRPDESRLIRALRYLDADLQMPPKQRLPEEVVADLAKWIEMGAPDPRLDTPPAAEAPSQGIDYDKGRQFWSFQPVRDPRPPAVKDELWIRSPIDRFILARLEARGLGPAAPADKRTLIRRATFDLTGLPPTPQEVADFLADDSPEAFATVIERLLASPAYGERWGRHWLDVARYTDSFDARFMNQAFDVNYAWQYRDWVVKAFNDDYPYDRFITDQIAGDILLERGGRPEQLVATSLLAIGEWGTGDSDKRKMMTDIVDDQVDVVGRGVLGLTVACARCHDHKFDPISTQDYYALAGFFFSSHILPAPGPSTNASDLLKIPALDPADRSRRQSLEEEAQKLAAEVDRFKAQGLALLAEATRHRTADYLMAAHELHRSPQGPAGRTESLAADRGLHPLIVQRWLAYLGLPDGAQPHLAGLMTGRVQDLLGNKGVAGWGEPSTPWLVVNPEDQARTILSFTLPPKGVAVHPAPDRPVAIGWRSPVAGRVAITGTISDADPNAGNGVVWILELRHDGERRVLSAGTIEPGNLKASLNVPVEVAEGDVISVVIDPRNNEHSCDTTAIELKVAEAGVAGGRAWDLAAEVVPDVHAGNPHADSYGHAAVWHFYALSGSPPTQSIEPGSALGSWVEALKRGAPVAELERLAEAVRAAVSSEMAPQGDATLRQALSAGDGYFLRGLDVTASLPADSQQAMRQLSDRLATIRAELAMPVPLVNGIQEGGVPTSEHEGFSDARVHIRGRYDRLGEVVPRGFPRVIADDSTPEIPANSSGRLELAQWVTSPSNPLTARVMVNRIWQHHFGRGIVPTPDNFGKLGTPPTHPDLLDWLALRFLESGWSIKAMHRLVMLSAAYQQSSIGQDQTVEADPDNELLGRMNRRRLEVESLRDTLLALSGRLDRTVGGQAVRDMTAPRRTLYIMTVRSDGANFRSLFDGADPTAIIAQRTESTVAPQSLFLLNHPFVLEQARAMAQRLIDHGPSDQQGRVALLYEWLYARPPSPYELRIADEILRAMDGADEVDAWQTWIHVLICANEFMYID